MIVPHILAYGYFEPFRTCGEVLRCYYPVGIAVASVAEHYTARCFAIGHCAGQQVHLHVGKHRRRVTILCRGVYQGGRQVRPLHAIARRQVDDEPVHQMLECQCHRFALACCGSGVEQVVRVVPRLGHIHVCRWVVNVWHGARDAWVVGGESHCFRLA